MTSPTDECKARMVVGLSTPPDGQTINHYIMSDIDIKKIADALAVKLVEANLNGKEVLTFDEAATYMGVSKSHLYKLTMGQEIPHYKPRGKMVYFKRVEVEQWLQNNRVCTISEAKAQANNYCRKGGVL